MSVNLADYQAARDDVALALDELAGLAALDADRAAAAHTAGRLRDGRFVLAVVGEFSSGKSFLLNALLEKIAFEERAGTTRIAGLLATDINPSTASITELSYAAEERATAWFPDGRSERIPLDGLARFVAVGDEGKLHDATAIESGAPLLVRVEVDSAFLRNGFVVADTPGLASLNPAHRRATLGYLPGADAVLYLIDTQQPFTDGDAAFLGLVRRSIASVFIVQTKIDLWRGEAGERAAWEVAAARIAAQAALHAPQTPVFPVSAREYAEGRLRGDAALIEQSRFPLLLQALDSALLATTGSARLQRAAAGAHRIAERTAAALDRDAGALAQDDDRLARAHAAAAPRLAALAAAATTGRAALDALGRALAAETGARGETLRAALHGRIVRAFDIADIARLRDRAKLHHIVDATLAAEIGPAAAEIAARVAEQIDAACADALTSFAAGPGADLPVADEIARAFGGDPESAGWSAGVTAGIRGTIVLRALGGPAVSLVAAIARRFAAAPSGTYMKRELAADLAAGLYAAFDAEIARFIEGIGAQAAAAADALGARIAALGERLQDDATGALERALAVPPAARPARATTLRARAERCAALAARIATRSAAFVAGAQLDTTTLLEPAPAGAAPPAAAGAVRFDPQTYEHGLRPERWRVVVLGAFKRGKSSLINALAETMVLGDVDGPDALHFPVHVRYGPVARAYALGDDAVWEPLAPGEDVAAARRTPVLIETPWSLPRELVLVHAPPFDSGLDLAEEIVAAAAAGASEILALFSRQLSERELHLYAKLAARGTPISFVHTIADNETPAERRRVVALAERYLRERAIVPQRIFTVSTRAAGAWNELGALRATLASHAEAHMERLGRAARTAAEHARLAAAAPPPAAVRASLWDRLRGRLR